MKLIAVSRVFQSCSDLNASRKKDFFLSNGPFVEGDVFVGHTAVERPTRSVKVRHTAQ